MGDFNVRLGREMPGISGKHCVHKHASEGGREMAVVCADFNLCAASTYFKQRKTKGHHGQRSDATWMPPPGTTTRANRRKPQQLDYVCISRRFKSAISQCRIRWDVCRERHGAYRQDHALLSCTLRCKPRRPAPPEKKCDWSALRTDPLVRAEFDVAFTKTPTGAQHMTSWNA